MSVFVLLVGYSGEQDIVSVHHTLEAAKQAGDQYRLGYPRQFLTIEEWEFDDRLVCNMWGMAPNEDWVSYDLDGAQT